MPTWNVVKRLPSLLFIIAGLYAELLFAQTHFNVSDTQEMETLFKQYGLQHQPIVTTGKVPAVFVDGIPVDLHQRAVSEYKDLYIFLLLPNITAINNEITAQRSRLLALKNKKNLSSDDQRWLKQLAVDYKVQMGDMAQLMLRVDVIPASLALAQSINETAWGSSRFAVQGNALFGQHLANGSKGKYIKARGADIKVATFATPLQGVRSYMHNLNTTKAYHSLRAIRQSQRQSAHKLDSVVLAAALAFYSETGQAYVHSLQRLIISNKLQTLDGLVLTKPEVFIVLP